MRVLENDNGDFACELAFGTKRLKLSSRAHRDLIIQNLSDMVEMGLAMATRFDLSIECRAILPWNPEHFGCWSGKKSPKIGTLLDVYKKEYAYIMI
jgi:hypothetical protein